MSVTLRDIFDQAIVDSNSAVSLLIQRNRIANFDLNGIVVYFLKHFEILAILQLMKYINILSPWTNLAFKKHFISPMSNIVFLDIFLKKLIIALIAKSALSIPSALEANRHAYNVPLVRYYFLLFIIY